MVHAISIVAIQTCKREVSCDCEIEMYEHTPKVQTLQGSTAAHSSKGKGTAWVTMTHSHIGSVRMVCRLTLAKNSLSNGKRAYALARVTHPVLDLILSHSHGLE